LHDSKRQTFADKIVGTVVVNVGKPATGHAGKPATGHAGKPATGHAGKPANEASGVVSGSEDRRLEE
jgi:hypothetical protein